MIKLKEINQTRYVDGKKMVDASLFADTKNEVTDDLTGEDIDGLEDDVIIDMGSFVMTASAEYAYMQSNGKWKWGE